MAGSRRKSRKIHPPHEKPSGPYDLMSPTRLSPSEPQKTNPNKSDNPISICRGFPKGKYFTVASKKSAAILSKDKYGQQQTGGENCRWLCKKRHCNSFLDSIDTA